MAKKIVAVFVLLFISQFSWSEYLGNVDPLKLIVSSDVTFGIDNAPSASTCNYFGRQFKFDATTDKGKNMLTVILAAYLSGKAINLWYTASSAPSTDNTTGCGPGQIAVVDQIGFFD